MSDISIERFLTAQEKRDLSPATLRALRSYLCNFGDWWEEKRQRPFTVSQLVSRDLRQQVDGVSPHTINRNLSSLRRFCGWAVTTGLLSENPTTSISDIPQAPPSPRSLPTGAIDALLRAPQQIADKRLRLRDEASMSLLVYVGLRTKNPRDLQLRDVDLAGASIVVQRGKGKKTRRIPLHTEAKASLDTNTWSRCAACKVCPLWAAKRIVPKVVKSH